MALKLSGVQSTTQTLRRVRNYLGDHKKSPKGDLRGLNFMLKETIRGLNQVQRGTLYKKSAKIMRNNMEIDCFTR